MVVASHQNGLLKECNKDTRITVTFTPTVPIVDDANQKHLSIKILVPDRDELQTKSAIDTCDLKLRHGMPPNESRIITITPVCDNIDQTNVGSMEYRFVIADFGQRFWFLYKLPSVRVSISNTPQKQCSSVTDPHYTTFDGRYYNFMPIGDYVLYKNTFTDTEVHARSWVCVHWSSDVTCNCGAAIREGADIIIFSVCNANLVQTPRLLKTEIRSEGGLAPGTHIIRTVQGSKVTHDVLLPSGNRVKVERYRWGLNIFVKAFAPKPNTIFGLCGNLNGRQDDEFHQGGDNQNYGQDAVSFGESWRVDPRKSNFNLRLPAPTTPPTAKQPKYCECPETEQQSPNCDWNANRFKDFKKIPGQDIADQFRNNRRRRSITGNFYSDDIMDYEERSFFVDEKEVQFALRRIRSRRSVSKEVMSNENATKHCRAVIEDSTAGKTCSDVPGFNLTSAMVECITDLKLTGEIKFAGAAFDSMKEACEEVALKNVSLYKSDASGKFKPPADIG
ncbi:von Willebrand factor D and EGF domain-containing protein, partial [Exaiptasia diaphana]